MDAERIIRTHIASGEASPIPSEILTGIEAGQMTLLDVVKGLAEYITSTDDDVRLRGVRLLTAAVKQTSPSKINRQATQVLTGFYCDKLDDGHCLPPILEGLCSLASLPTFGDGDTTKVYRAVVENVKMRSFVQSTRFFVFSLVDILLSKHKSALQGMGNDFVNSYCKLAQGEKDPRNLLLGFSIVHVILVDFDIYQHLEDLYDIVFCYFPITFRPPPDDPYGITTDDLKLALRKCMAATPRFAPLAMPLFLEKLPPSLGASKRDVLQTLTACIPVYGSSMVLGYVTELWESLKTEIFYSSDPNIEQDSLDCLQVLVKTLYPGPQDKPTGLAEEILKECLETLKEPEKSKALPGTKVLGVLIKASPVVGAFALSQTLPQMFKQYHTHSEVPHRGPIITVIANLLRALKEVYSPKDTERHQDEEKTIERFRDEIMSILTAGIQNTSLATKKPALDGYIQLVQIPGFLTEEEVGYIVLNINSLVVEAGAEDLRDEAVAGLSVISTISSKSIETISLPLLFSKLPDTAPGLDDVVARQQYKQILASLTILCAQPGLFEILVVRVMTKLESLCEIQFTPAGEAMDVDVGEEAMIRRECEVAYAHALLSCMLASLKKKVADKHVDVAKYFDQVVPRLFSMFIGAVVGKEDQLAADVRLLEVAASIIEVVTQTLNTDRQTKFAQILFTSYQDGQMKALLHQNHPVEHLTPVKPLDASASLREQNLVILFSAAVVALRSDVDLGLASLDQFMEDLLLWGVQDTRKSQNANAAVYAVSSLVNKRAPSLENFVSFVLGGFWERVSGAQSTSTRPVKAWIWIARALLVRSHSKGVPMIIKIFDTFTSGDESSLNAARSLSVLADKRGDVVLSKSNHAVVKLLFKQKLFNYLLPAIIDGCKSTQAPASQRAYLVALGSTISIIPRTLVMSDLPQLLPLLLRALTLSDPEMQSNLIDALTGIIEVEDSSKDETINGQATTLVERLLDIATQIEGKASSQRSRVAALRCLAVFPDAVRYDVLHPVKQKVTRELAKALDDPKRRVRKEAVDTRAKWFRYGAAV